ncbi:uncharacterized protein C12orf60 homolog [Erethizon dorsatum]
MFLELEKNKERLIEAAKMFFFHIQDLVSFTNKFIDLFNFNMNTQILLMSVKEDCNIKEFFEQMLKNCKEMKSVLDAKQNKMQIEPLCSKVAMAVSFVAEKCTNMELPHSAKGLFSTVQTPVIVSVLRSSNILGSLESLLSQLMTFPIMNLQLSDFYREDTKEQSDATTSGKTMNPDLSKTTTKDTLKKLQEVLKTENASNPGESAADHLEQIVKAMEPALHILQNAIQTVETSISKSKKVIDK